MKRLFALLVALFSLFPLYWALLTATRKGEALHSRSLIPGSPDLSNFAHVLGDPSFARDLMNSVLCAALTVTVSLVLGLPAAFATSRRRFRGRGALLTTILLISVFPQIAVLSGLFELLRALHLFNQIPGLALAYLIFTLPFTIWTLHVFLRDLPLSIEEAALLDGASTGTLITRIIAPLLAPALVTTLLLGFIAAWNEFLFALTFTLTDRARTVPVAIALMSGASEHEIPWGSIMAASVIVTIPVIALVILFQRRIVSGLTAGAVKG